MSMTNVFLINAHEPGFGSYSPGRLNRSLFDKAHDFCDRRGFNVRTTHSAEPWNSDEEIEKHLWCDYLLIQSPVNWMGFLGVLNAISTLYIPLMVMKSSGWVLAVHGLTQKKITELKVLYTVANICFH